MLLLRRLAISFALAGCAVACGVALMVCASIVGRSAFGKPISGDVELTQMGIALTIALCLPWCQARGANIVVDFFTKGTHARTLRVLDGIGCLLLAMMVGLLAWRTVVGALAVRQAQETTMILGAPMWIAYAVLAPGLALTGVIALAQALQHFKGQAMDPAA